MTTAASTKPTQLWIAALSCASFLIAAAVAWGVFEAVPHLEDETANLFQARIFSLGYVTIPAYEPNMAFYIPFTLRVNGYMFSKYPPGYALLLAVGVLAGQPWIVNALAAALGILGVWMLGRELFDNSTGLLAAGLGVLSPMFIMLSGTLLSHTSSLALLAWFAWAFVRARRSEQPHSRRYALLAGSLLGLAAAARPLTAAAVGLPFAVLALADFLRAPRRQWIFLLCLAAGMLLTGFTWPAYNQVATDSPFTNTYRLYWPYDAVGFGPQFGQNGHTLQEGIDNIRADLDSFNEASLGWPVAWGFPLMWAVIGLGLALRPRERSRWEFFLLAPVAALALVHGAYWTRSAGLYGPRYYAEAMPFVWLLAARALLKLGRFTSARRAIQVLLPLCMLWGIAVSIGPRFNQGRNLYNISRADATLIQAADLHNALVFVASPYWTDYARLSWLNHPLLEPGAVIFARDLGVNSNLQVASQFPGRAIYSFDRLRSPALRACPQPCALLQPLPKPPSK